MAIAFAAPGAETPPSPSTSQKASILYILADDLGYGDVQCLNPERGKIATPHMHRLAGEGMTFTDAHTSSSVCTPTRYSILTGRYNWRTKLQSAVLMGFDEPLIAPDRLTVAGLLKQQGYRTACIGKWHLGLGLPTVDGKPMNTEGLSNVDWSGKITGGPVDLGFDDFHGISASCDQLISLNDLMATCAELAGAELPDTAGEDSVSFLPALLEKPIVSTRAGVIHHSFSGHFAYRLGNWKLLLARSSGGWTSPTEEEVLESAPRAQLYDMENDPGETTNLYESRPEVAARLLQQLESDVQCGRSIAGPAAKNDVADIQLWKSQ